MLADPVRRDLYEYVADAGHEVGRATATVGMARTLAAFHLDMLVDGRLREVAPRWLTGRSGPSAGRPAEMCRAMTHAEQYGGRRIGVGR